MQLHTKARTHNRFSLTPTACLYGIIVHYDNGTDNVERQAQIYNAISDVHYPLCKLNLCNTFPAFAVPLVLEVELNSVPFSVPMKAIFSI